MEHLATVTNHLLTAKAELEQELAQVNKMLAVVQPQENDDRPKRTTKEAGSRWDNKNGAGKKPEEPTPAATKTKKKYPVKAGIAEDLLAVIQARKIQGKSFTDSVPGSVTAQELATETKYSIGTVRRAIAQLEAEGKVASKPMSWKDLGLTKPQATTKVVVAA